MAEISSDEVGKIARLARLTLSDAETEAYRRSLGDILGYIEKLNALDTTGIEPLGHVLPLTNVMRADEVTPSLPVERALANAPDRAGDHFRVPRIIE